MKGLLCLLAGQVQIQAEVPLLSSLIKEIVSHWINTERYSHTSAWNVTNNVRYTSFSCIQTSYANKLPI